MSERNELGATEDLMDLIFMALDHGVSSVEDGGPLVPFVLVDDGRERHIHRFVADSLQDERERALAFAADLPSGAQRYAIATDGFIRLDTGRVDAIIVEAAELDMTEGLVFAQTYQPKRFLRKARSVGNPSYIRNTDNLLIKSS